MIALFDILGFEERLSSDGLSRLVDAYTELATIVKEKRGALILDACANARQQDDGTIVSNVAMGILEVEQAYFSDTIIFWGQYDRARFWTFCDICSEFVCQVLRIGMPIRGGIAVGEAHLDKGTNTYLGYPLVEAARVERTQQWIGVSFGPSFMQEPFRRLFRLEHVMFYTAHRRADSDASQWIPGLVLDWPRKWRQTFGDSPCRQLSQLNTRPKYARYYERSIHFAELSEQFQRKE